MTIGQSSVTVIGGSVDYKKVNLALILGICIPVGVLCNFIFNFSNCWYSSLCLLQEEKISRCYLTENKGRQWIYCKRIIRAQFSLQRGRDKKAILINNRNQLSNINNKIRSYNGDFFNQKGSLIFYLFFI